MEWGRARSDGPIAAESGPQALRRPVSRLPGGCRSPEGLQPVTSILPPASRPRRHIVVLHTDSIMLELERELLTDEQYRFTTMSTDADAAVLIGTMRPDQG